MLAVLQITVSRLKCGTRDLMAGLFKVLVYEREKEGEGLTHARAGLAKSQTTKLHYRILRRPLFYSAIDLVFPLDGAG